MPWIFPHPRSQRQLRNRMTLWLTLLLMLHCGLVQASPQVLTLGQNAPYNFLAFANQDLHEPVYASRAVVVLHGVRRNADTYYTSGLKLLQNADATIQDTLLLAPNYLTAHDRQANAKMPLWSRDSWMHGTDSEEGRRAINSLAVLDDLLRYLADRQHFPNMKEIILIGHSAGGQLLQRYSLLGTAETRLASQGLHVRYIVSSPSSYLYLEASRLQDGSFMPLSGEQCPSFNRYHYGLEQAPRYLNQQHLNAEQLFRRYAMRDVTFMVGEHDNNPEHRLLDRSCAAHLQGTSRLERQLNYLRYETFLANQWQVPIHHAQITIAGVGHNAEHLLASKTASHLVLPTH